MSESMSHRWQKLPRTTWTHNARAAMCEITGPIVRPVFVYKEISERSENSPSSHSGE
jgi:hypothetical protein